MLNGNAWNYLTVCKQISSNNLLENKVTYKLFTNKSYILQDLALNNPQVFICHKIPTKHQTN